MKVKLLCSRSGVGFSHRPNEEIEVDDAEGLRMISAGQCVPVDLPQGEAERVATEEAARVAAEEAERVAAEEAERVATEEAARVAAEEAERVATEEAARVAEAKEKLKAETATKKVSTEKAVKK